MGVLKARNLAPLSNLTSDTHLPDADALLDVLQRGAEVSTG